LFKVEAFCTAIPQASINLLILTKCELMRSPAPVIRLKNATVSIRRSLIADRRPRPQNLCGKLCDAMALLRGCALRNQSVETTEDDKAKRFLATTLLLKRL
jgi:hypothetical protein